MICTHSKAQMERNFECNVHKQIKKRCVTQHKNDKSERNSFRNMNENTWKERKDKVVFDKELHPSVHLDTDTFFPVGPTHLQGLVIKPEPIQHIFYRGKTLEMSKVNMRSEKEMYREREPNVHTKIKKPPLHHVNLRGRTLLLENGNGRKAVVGEATITSSLLFGEKSSEERKSMLEKYKDQHCMSAGDIRLYENADYVYGLWLTNVKMYAVPFGYAHTLGQMRKHTNVCIE